MKKKQKVKVILKSHDQNIIDISIKNILACLSETEAVIKGPVPLPTKRSLMTVLISPHIDKDAREQYEIHTYMRLLEIIEPSSATLNALMKLELSAGVDVNIKTN